MSVSKDWRSLLAQAFIVERLSCLIRHSCSHCVDCTGALVATSAAMQPLVPFLKRRLWPYCCTRHENASAADSFGNIVIPVYWNLTQEQFTQADVSCMQLADREGVFECMAPLHLEVQRWLQCNRLVALLLQLGLSAHDREGVVRHLKGSYQLDIFGRHGKPGATLALFPPSSTLLRALRRTLLSDRFNLSDQFRSSVCWVCFGDKPDFPLQCGNCKECSLCPLCTSGTFCVMCVHDCNNDPLAAGFRLKQYWFAAFEGVRSMFDTP